MFYNIPVYKVEFFCVSFSSFPEKACHRIWEIEVLMLWGARREEN
jgi:hypothetical protein